ncbi:LOW QUALITY PROTEIN: hypothetical protein MXB_3871 [Myxobolus squamalis]|nr:LOW QUALITY PROTEIN: hypothetical protein MXB_3871 [Myxobolus squamalis]
MSAKDEYLYYEHKLIVVDLDKALLNAVCFQFTGTRIMLLPLLTRASLKDDKAQNRSGCYIIGDGLLTCSEDSFEHTLSALENSPTFTSRQLETFWRYFKNT